MAALQDGRLSVDFADKKAAYEIVDTYYAENFGNTQYILQYNTIPADIDDTKFVAGLGDTTTDQLGKICFVLQPLMRNPLTYNSRNDRLWNIRNRMEN